MLEPKRAAIPQAHPHPHRLAFGNRILDALPPPEAERLAPLMRRVFLQRDQVVFVPTNR